LISLAAETGIEAFGEILFIPAITMAVIFSISLAIR